MKYLVIGIALLAFSCNKTENTTLKEEVKTPELSLEWANKLSKLPLHCITTEYPNKLGQVLEDSTDLKPPATLHPAFYGCFDWHSAVHGHWSLVSLLKQFPNLDASEEIKSLLLQNISKENILQEVAYFESDNAYERTYGWTWLLKLASELHTWNDPFARTLEANLQPLTDHIVSKYIEFLPKLNYPIRVGTHTNTAFGLTFALEYANLTNNLELKNSIVTTAKRFYTQDANGPMNWEPNGYDFLSPCLEEAALMKMVLDKEVYKTWLKSFLPQVFDANYHLETGKVSDREDGLLVHLDGVNFSRAWCLVKIAEDLPELDHLNRLAAEHINYSLPNLVGDSYEGGHWLASFAINALNSMENIK